MRKNELITEKLRLLWGKFMDFKEICVPQLKYDRTMEILDEWLVLFKISVDSRTSVYYYHFCFNDIRKPPLDIAFHPEDGTVGYVSYFLQDEIIENVNTMPKIRYKNTSIRFYDKRFDFDHLYVDLDKQFHIFKNKRDIWVLHETAWEKELNAYEIGNNNHLLFIDNSFVGLKMGEFSEQEIQELYNSKCFSILE